MDSTEEAQVAFCRREFPRLVGTLTLYCGDPDVAADLAQEALARACRRWGRVSEMAAPGAWVHRVGINLANRHFRRHRSEQEAARRAEALNADPLPADEAEAVAVRAAVADLPRRQRTALVLRYFSDLPVRDVAELMGCREGTVKALTSQAIAALRQRSGLLPDDEEAHDAR